MQHVFYNLRQNGVLKFGLKLSMEKLNENVSLFLWCDSNAATGAVRLESHCDQYIFIHRDNASMSLSTVSKGKLKLLKTISR